MFIVCEILNVGQNQWLKYRYGYGKESVNLYQSVRNKLHIILKAMSLHNNKTAQVVDLSAHLPWVDVNN